MEDCQYASDIVELEGVKPLFSIDFKTSLTVIVQMSAAGDRLEMSVIAQDCLISVNSAFEF
jgi:hypothetical protein